MPIGSFAWLKHLVKTMQSLHVGTQYLLHVDWEFMINNHSSPMAERAGY